VNHAAYVHVFASLGCHFTYSLDDSGGQIDFTSPNFFGKGYPLAQKCTWRFVAPEKKRPHIDFVEVDIEGEDEIEIQSGWNGGSSVGSIGKSGRPNGNGYSPSDNSDTALFVKFESKASSSSRKRSKGFRGIFKVTASKGE